MKIIRNHEIKDSVVNLLKEVRKFSQDISYLLMAADGIFTEQGWKPAEGNTSGGDHSKSLTKPYLWYTQFYYRLYQNKSHYPKKQLFITILLDEQDNPDKYIVTEPLIIIGIITRVRTMDKIENWKAKLHTWHTYSLENDNQFYVTEPEGAWKDSEKNYSKMITKAVPLDVITDDKVLKEFITPVFEELKKY